MQDFQLALKRLVRRHKQMPPGIYASARDFVRECHSPRGALSLLDAWRQCRVTGIVVPLSESGAIPSMSEALRVVAAQNLVNILHARNIGPCVVVLWPGIPTELDTGPRFVVSREGEPQSSLFASAGRISDVAGITGILPPTDFTPALTEGLSATWHANPSIWKLRLLFRYALKTRALGMPADIVPGSGRGSSVPATPRALYRTRLARLIEHLPVVCVMHPDAGETVPIDIQISEAFGGEVIPFAANAVTIVEGKVERWLEKFRLAPESLLAPKVQLSKLIAQLFPADAAASVTKAREAVLAKFFRLENQLDEAGYEGRSTVSLDRLANQIDGQFDRLKAGARSIELRERETALHQLTKARSYLAPGTMPQAHAMSLLHYINFYGADFVEELAESVEVGDGRHHLLYMGG